MTSPPNKARKYKICIDFFLTHYTTMLRFSQNWFFFNVLMKLFKTATLLQNKGNMTSKKLRSQQIETKSLTGKGVFSSLVVTWKTEYLLGWINKVWMNKYVESCSGVKESCEVERWQGWPEKWIYGKKLSLLSPLVWVLENL